MRRFLLFCILGGLFLLFPWIYISWQVQDLIYRDIDLVPSREVGVLLGTTPGVNGSNLFFQTRIEATKQLYEKKKIKKILVSGDNSDKTYNEPEYMKNALIRSGVHPKDITLDYAGFRTLDSVIRAKEVFSLTGGFILISQPFHIERALYLAKANHIDAIGFGSANVSLEYGLFAYIREIPARFLALYDAWTGTEATVLGKTEVISF